MSDEARTEGEPITINGKPVDLVKVPHLLKPFREWTVGHLKGLERAGFSVVGATPGRMTLEELVAVVTYVATQANRDIVAADVESLDPDAFGKVLQPIMDRILPPASAQDTQEKAEPPFPGSPAASSTP